MTGIVVLIVRLVVLNVRMLPTVVLVSVLIVTLMEIAFHLVPAVLTPPTVCAILVQMVALLVIRLLIALPVNLDTINTRVVV